MKAVILAAGKGTRMGKYTQDLPKGMLIINGKTLIERQLETLRAAGINDIIIITGYMNETIKYDGVKYYHNADFASTNMVETLMCARSEFGDDVVVAYSDILYTEELVRRVIGTKGGIVVAVDSAWRKYWEMRYGTTEHDLETLNVENGRITGLGKETAGSQGIEYRYIGAIKYSADSWDKVFKLYDGRRDRNEKWPASGREFVQGYMTDLLNELIAAGVEVVPCVTARQWLEFDTEQDYEITVANMTNGKLKDVTDVKV